MFVKPVTIITGPTASGKTDFSYRIAQSISVEIVNADMGQFYKPCTIGTAKPDWQNHHIRHHLFDIIDTPDQINVRHYRQLLIQKIADIQARGAIPLIVGGSLFYIHSLFFPPCDLPNRILQSDTLDNNDSQISWQELYKIDPARALTIHPHDIYRIGRALAIWRKTGKKPSSIVPIFKPICEQMNIIFLTPSRQTLYQRIKDRLDHMLAMDIQEESWLNEAKRLYGTLWEEFLYKKKIIGYPELFDWIKNGQKHDELAYVRNRILYATRKYAKRQLIFAQRLQKQLRMHASCSKIKWVVIDEKKAEQDISNFSMLCNQINEVEKKNISATLT